VWRKFRHLWRAYRFTALLGLVVLLVNLVSFLRPAVDSVYPALPTRCASQVPLTVHSEPAVFGRHQQWLETPHHFADQGLGFWRLQPHQVVDLSTGRAYRWTINPVDRGQEQLRFEVLSRWSILHPGWDSHPWALLYDCPPGVDGGQS